MNTIKGTLNPTDNDVVVITESARPLASSALIKSVTLAVNGYDGALPIIPIKDTVYESPDKINIDSVPERDFLFIGQSPEAFVFHKYYDIHLGMTSEALANCHGSAQLAYDNGFKIHLILMESGACRARREVVLAGGLADGRCRCVDWNRGELD